MPSSTWAARPILGKRSHRNVLDPHPRPPRFVAEEPEHCHDCYRFFRSGQRYFLTIEPAIMCPDCARIGEAIRLTGGLTVEVGEDRLLIRRGSPR
jgi:hypothetical protein